MHQGRYYAKPLAKDSSLPQAGDGDFFAEKCEIFGSRRAFQFREESRDGGGKLGGNFRQDIHAADLGCDAELLAHTLFEAHYTRMATHPALLARGQFRGQD